MSDAICAECAYVNRIRCSCAANEARPSYDYYECRYPWTAPKPPRNKLDHVSGVREKVEEGYQYVSCKLKNSSGQCPVYTRSDGIGSFKQWVRYAISKL